MNKNRLKLNDSKTEFMVLGTKHRLNKIKTTSIAVGTIGIVDDGAVYGENVRMHGGSWRSAIRMISFSTEKKCSVKTKSINFFGEIYDAKEGPPDPKRVEDIKEIKTPTSTTELQHILGMITYMSPFIPRLSEHTANIRYLLKKDSVFK